MGAWDTGSAAGAFFLNFKNLIQNQKFLMK